MKPTVTSGLAPLASKSKLNEAIPAEKTSAKRKREALAEVRSTAANVRRGRENEVAGKANEKKVEDTKPATKVTVSRVPTREALKAVGGVNQVRAHSRSASVSTTASDVPAKKAKVVTGKVTVKKESIVEHSSRRPVFTKKPPVKVEDPTDLEDGRVAKRGRMETVPEATASTSHLDESKVEEECVAAELQDDSQLTKVDEPEVQLWDDLDAADWDDPQSVAEYVAEVCVYLREVEVSIIARFPLRPNLNKISPAPNPS